MGSVRYVRSEEVLWRRNPGEVVLLALGDDEVVRLPGTGGALWDQLSRPISLDDVAAGLGRVYSAAPERVAAEIQPLLDELVRRGAVARLTDSWRR